MVLRSSPASPFARKVRIAANLLGLASRIDVQPTDLNDPSDSVRRQNPLGKIPVLVLEDGATYYDSRVILEYLDHLAGGGKIIPRDPSARFPALRLQALCDGMLDASILLVYESRYRPADKQVASWIERQDGKVARGLQALEAEPPGVDPIPHVGQISLACLLGYRDLRFPGTWRDNHPKLAAWLERFARQVPAYTETKAAA